MKICAASLFAGLLFTIIPIIGGDAESLELDDMPLFEAPRLSVGEAAAGAPRELGLLAVESILFFVFAFVGFLRYDVR